MQHSNHTRQEEKLDESEWCWNYVSVDDGVEFVDHTKIMDEEKTSRLVYHEDDGNNGRYNCISSNNNTNTSILQDILLLEEDIHNDLLTNIFPPSINQYTETTNLPNIFSSSSSSPPPPSSPNITRGKRSSQDSSIMTYKHHQNDKRINQLDVLCGRGALQGAGNILFREKVFAAVASYTTAQNAIDRLYIVDRIIQSIHEMGGRFIQKKTMNNHKKQFGGKNNHHTDQWIELDTKSLRHKVIRALRDAMSPSTKSTRDRSRRNIISPSNSISTSTFSNHGINSCPLSTVRGTNTTTSSSTTTSSTAQPSLAEPLSSIVAVNYNNTNTMRIDDDSGTYCSSYSTSTPSSSTWLNMTLQQVIAYNTYSINTNNIIPSSSSPFLLDRHMLLSPSSEAVASGYNTDDNTMNSERDCSYSTQLLLHHHHHRHSDDKLNPCMMHPSMILLHDEPLSLSEYHHHPEEEERNITLNNNNNNNDELLEMIVQRLGPSA